MAVMIKNITTYQKAKPVYEAYRKAKNKKQHRTAYKSDLMLYEAEHRQLLKIDRGQAKNEDYRERISVKIVE